MAENRVSRTQTDEGPSVSASSREAHSSMDVARVHAAVMRENEEPGEGKEPTPFWLLIAFTGLVGWGGWYVGTYSAGFVGEVMDAPAVPVMGVAQNAAPVDPMVLGQRTFVVCQTCHQADGRGVPGTYPPLAGSERVQGRPEVMARIVLNGLVGKVTVRGATFDNAMPGHRTRLDDERIAAVMTYVRSSFGNSASAVTPELVAAARQATEGRSEPWTDPELDAVDASLPPAGAAPTLVGAASASAPTMASVAPPSASAP
jgi:mono/diheme cytochrome c family protein